MILGKLFSTSEERLKEIIIDDSEIERKWHEYLTTIPKKQKNIKQLDPKKDNSNGLNEIKRMLELELKDVSVEEKDEKEIINDFEMLNHDKRLWRIQRLHQAVYSYENRYEYVYQYLELLLKALKNEMHIITALLSKPKKMEQLISHLKSESIVESEIINKLIKLKTFHSILLALLKGEHIISRMNKEEALLSRKMQKGLDNVLSGKIKTGVLTEWTRVSLNGMEDEIANLIAQGALSNSSSSDLEYVNSGAFESLVREAIPLNARKKISEPMIKVFIKIVREWYTYQRDNPGS